MDYTERLENVSVLGAAGKMGSGILLLTAVEITDLSLQPKNKDKEFVVYAMDVSGKALNGLMKYIRTQVVKIAEKKIVLLRKFYEDNPALIENGEIIDRYTNDVMNNIRPTTKLESTYDSSLIFEAIKEDPDLKVKIFSNIKNNSSKDPWFFTNTSSIPISKLDKEAELDGKVLGVHFYNPPAVQKLVEIIKGENTREELNTFALEYSKRLRKVVVPSNDFAGFIGNGHFMRDALHGINEAERLSSENSFSEAVYMINKVSQKYLVRPMGIFQLIDYVGIDVCSYIMSVMNPYLKDEDLHSPLLDKMVEMNVLGGQNSDGSQKNGFLKYEKGKPVAVFDIDKKDYVNIDSFKDKADKALGEAPTEVPAWKAMIMNKNKAKIFEKYFRELIALNSLGAELAIKYGKRSCEIGKKLVEDNVAFTEKDVNTVMLTGFFHAYGPVNEYFL